MLRRTGDEATNLIVEQPGNKRADEIVAARCPLRHRFSTTPGADDNASAWPCCWEVAGLLLETPVAATARYVPCPRRPPYFQPRKNSSPQFLGGQKSPQHHARESRRRGEQTSSGNVVFGMVELTTGFQFPGVSPLFSSLMSFLKESCREQRTSRRLQMVIQGVFFHFDFRQTRSSALRHGGPKWPLTDCQPCCCTNSLYKVPLATRIGDGKLS